MGYHQIWGTIFVRSWGYIRFGGYHQNWGISLDLGRYHQIWGTAVPPELVEYLGTTTRIGGITSDLDRYHQILEIPSKFGDISSDLGDLEEYH